MSHHAFRFCWSLLLCVFGLGPTSVQSHACTTAVVSGSVTADGRPLLWKNRDTSSLHNELVLFTEGKLRFTAVVNAGSRSSVWMGMNERGFCIENSLSKDLASSSKAKGPGNGALMKLALATCATVADFERLLEKTNVTGRTTTANFGVIDAQGGAALFETAPHRFAKFDANDPQTAPHGYIVRSNFSMSGQGFAEPPQADALKEVYSGERFLRACSLIDSAPGAGLNVGYVLRHMSRDLADRNGQPIPGSVNRRDGRLPERLMTDHTISRTTTVSAAVFHGVRPGEDPHTTTMWTLLGDPKFSVAIPCWVQLDAIADPLIDPRGGELGELAIALRGHSLSQADDGVSTSLLPGIWDDLWRLEDQALEQVAAMRQQWTATGFSSQQATALHAEIASRAMSVMEQELQDVGLAKRQPAELVGAAADQ